MPMPVLVVLIAVAVGLILSLGDPWFFLVWVPLIAWGLWDMNQKNNRQ